MADLRTLAQAVVDAPTRGAFQLACEGLAAALGLGRFRWGDVDTNTARAILAALNDERAQAFNDGVASALPRGYARAMGEVMERCEGDAGLDWYDISEWARERAAAAEREREG